MRPLASVAGTRWTRWTPDSNLRRAKTPFPVIEAMIVPAEVVLRHGDDLDFPAVQVRIAAVHAEEIGSKERGFVAARAGAHLEDDVALVGGVLGQELDLELMLERLEAAVDGAQLLLGEGGHLTIGAARLDHRRQLVAFLLRPAQGLDRRDDGIDLGKLLRKAREVGRTRTGVELGLHDVPALDQPVELLLRNRHTSFLTLFRGEGERAYWAV